MRKINFIILLLGLFITNEIIAQDQFTVQIEPLTITNAPNIHSFSWGKTNDGMWIIIGGRIDGLHQRQPNTAFLEK